MVNITDEEFRLLAEFIEEQSGIHLKGEKKALVVGRLGNLLPELGVKDFTSYYQLIKNDKDGTQLSRLIDKITTNHTYFMRESEHFEYFVQTVLPYWEGQIKDHDFRIWCAASSSGEEPYTLAIMMEEYFKTVKGSWDKKLLATDLSLNVLTQAKNAVYTGDKLSALPRIWVLNYFDRLAGDEYQVKQSMRNQVIFRRFNLLEPVFPFKKKFHVIFCRNVMIYFDNDTKETLINKMYDALEYGGYLFIGHSESINRDKTKFKYIKPAVYRKI